MILFVKRRFSFVLLAMCLVVGCGAGVTAGTFVVHPEVERITICEIEPLIPPASARFFRLENHNVMRDRRTSDRL